MVYSGYEERVLQRLTVDLPEYRGALKRILALPRVDLLALLRGHYYDHNFRGSFSLKAVVPVLAPDLSYESLEIQDGSTAARTFLKLADYDAGRRTETRAALRRYCGRDTEALVRIIDALRRASTGGPEDHAA